MDRCTRLEEICTNWASTPKLPITDHLLNQMKHRSRLLGIAVAPLLFSRPARNLFQNDSTLRANNTLSLDPPAAVRSGSVANRMTSKRKSVAIPVDYAIRRFVQSVDENEYQIAQGQFLRGDPSRSTTDQVQHLQAMQNFAEQFCSHLQSTYKFQQMSTKLTPRKIARSVHVPSPIEFNLHRSDHSRRATILAEVSTLNNVQLIVRFLQYDTVKFSSNSNRRVISSDFRSSDLSWIAPEQTELDAFAYDFHLQRIVRHQTNPDELQGFTGDFSLIVFLQDFIEYYPQAPIGAKTALFKTCIRHQLDGNKRTGDSSLLFKYVLDRAANYNIRAAKRMSDEYLFDCDSPDVHWIAARSTPSSSTELFISMYIIYTNLSPKQQNTPILTAPSLNKQSIASTNRPRTSLTSNNSSNNIRERSTTVLLPPPKVNLVVPIRSNSFSSDQSTQNNIPKERNVEYFKSKLTSILNKASVSHRREHLWSKLIALRSDGIDRRREDSTPINDIEFEILLDSCVGDEKLDLNLITSLLQRVFANREQTERLNKFLRSRYNNQYHILNSINATYLIILQCKTSQQCDAFLVLAYRSDQNSLKSYLVKHQSDIDCVTFIETFTQRISYFLWECLV